MTCLEKPLKMRVNKHESSSRRADHTLNNIDNM
jgi:hypothetical protein